MAAMHTLQHKEVLLELLLIATRRPSSHCAHHLQQPRHVQPRFIRNATTGRTPPSQSPSTVQKPQSPSPSSFRPSASPTNSAAAAATSKARSDPTSVPLRMLLDRNPSNTSTISKIPIPKGERGETFTPSPLTRPLGIPYPPQPGQNAPQINRSWRERRADWADSSNIQARRRVLVRNFLRPYFQEWNRLKDWKGKSFVANERLFRRERALWFPNLWGWTLDKRDDDAGNGGRDTTPVLKGKVSLVGIQSGVWAEEQVATFLGEAGNPGLKSVMQTCGPLVQKIEVNVQDRWFRALLVKLFKGRLRKMRPRSEWGRYFSIKMVRDVGNGFTEDIRDAIGLLNSQVGYVYLLDTDCRIRWAGSGHAWQAEIKSLNAGVQRLVQEAKEQRKVPTMTGSARGPEAAREGDLQAQVDKALA